MKIEVINKKHNMDNRPLERDCILSSSECPLAILYEYLNQWKNENAIIILDETMMSKLFEKSLSNLSNSAVSRLYFNDDKSEYIDIKTNLDTHDYEVIKGNLGDINYKGPILTTDVCVVKLVSSRSQTNKR